MSLLRCLNQDLVVVLSSLQTNRNKRKGSEGFYWPRIIVICVILQARMISADDFLQTCYQDIMIAQ